MPSSASVTAVMRANRKVDTRPEIVLRSALHRAGARFRKHLEVRTDELRVRPDIVFPSKRVAVFLDGCFWHSCPDHGVRPGTNTAYWRAKLERNRARDESVNSSLASAGWKVVRVWEHVTPVEAAAEVMKAVRAVTGVR